MTQYKYEYQAIAISLKNTIKENVNHQQLIFQIFNHSTMQNMNI